MITYQLLRSIGSLPRIGEYFRGEHPPAEIAQAASRFSRQYRIVAAVIAIALLVAAAAMARGSEDKALNYAVVLADPLAYILARLAFGRC